MSNLPDAAAEPSATERFRALLEGMREPIITHRQGRILHVNAAARELLGYSFDEMVGRPATDFVHSQDRAYVAGRLRSMTPGRRTDPTREHRLVKKDGGIVPVDVYTVPSLDDREVTFMSFIRDQTEKKRLETQLSKADRLASLGRLAAAVGHEINNPLAYVMGMIDVLERDVSEASVGRPELVPLLARFATIREGASRIRDIVRDLKPLASDREAAHGPVDLHRVLDRCVEMAAHETRGRARVVKRLGPIPHALGSETRLTQVFLNLIVNAAQAIDSGTPDDNEISVTTRDLGAGWIAVDVDDTGKGVPEELADRVFEPFFTTKADWIGTGLGLSVCHHIVTAHGGTISLSPREGRGTSVRVVLPAAPREAAKAPRTVSSPASIPRARLLIVDDEPNFGVSLACMLRDLDVTVARGGHAALEQLRDRSFDVILCDLHMADLSGMDLYDRVCASHPGLERRMIFMTAGAFTDRAREFVSRVPRPCLEKPFSAEQLQEALAAALREPD